MASSHPTVKVQQILIISELLTRGTKSSLSLARPNHDFEGIRSHNPTELLCLTVALKQNCTREIT